MSASWDETSLPDGSYPDDRSFFAWCPCGWRVANLPDAMQAKQAAAAHNWEHERERSAALWAQDARP